MCNLYSQTKAVEAILRLFRIGHNRAIAISPQKAIFPAYTAPVVRRAEDGERELVAMTWGFVLLQPGKAPRRVTNTRDDNRHSRFWRQSFDERRCLIPATSFCEPHDDRKPATWHWFALSGSDDPRPLFAFAGIWQRWCGPVKKDGPNIEVDVYSFMTTLPNELTSSINHERSPVLLTTDEARDAWIDGTTAEAEVLLRPTPAEKLRIVREGFEKEDPTP